MADLKAVKADAVQGEGVTLTLHGRRGDAKITVPPFADWGDEAYDRMVTGRIRAWAEAALDAQNLAAWASASPTNRQSAEFLEEWGRLIVGGSLGESEASSDS